MDRESKTAKATTGARPPVARRSRPRAAAADTRTVAERLADALAQQAATSAILRVMSASPTDVQPVMEAVAEQAARLCHAQFARVLLADGGTMRPLAQYPHDAQSPNAMHDVPLKRTSITGRAVLERATIHHADALPLLDSEFPDAWENAREAGFRAILAVPLLHRGDAYGALFLWRREPGLFTPDQVALIETFATQAAIAIANVQLFQATREALEQQTATSEILRVISRSQTDVQPVLQTIATASLVLCQASSAVVATFDGTLAHIGGLASTTPEGADAIRQIFPRPASRDNGITRAVLTCATVMIPDVRDDPDYATTGPAIAAGFRSVLAVPLMRDGLPIGAISLGRTEPGPFPATQATLLTTFADQAVIAIENVRLFSELGIRNRDLTEALEQQMATAEILRVIASSPTDTQPVFDLVAQRAGALCNAEVAVVSRYDSAHIELAAIDGLVPDAVQIVRGLYPMQVHAQTVTARTIRSARIVHTPDVLADKDYPLREFALAAHYRAGLGVPIIRDDQVIGSIFVGRSKPGLFTDSQVELLKTFADQAVIAIENVRLFTELGVRNQDLSEALEQQTATNDVLRVISRSTFDLETVLQTLIDSAARLCDADSGTVTREKDGQLYRVASHGYSREFRDNVKDLPVAPGRGSATGRVLLEGRVIHIADVQADPEYTFAEVKRSGEVRTVLGVPMLREGKPIGVLTLTRNVIRTFTDKQIELVTAFADQAVIAIENVRLFRELADRNHDLTTALDQRTATAEILRVINDSRTDLQPVFDIIAESAEKLCGADVGVVSRVNGAMIELVALHGMTSAGAGAVRRWFPMPFDAETISARTVRGKAVIHVPDVLADPAYDGKDAALAAGYRACLGVPMLRGNEVIGAIFVARPQPGWFDDAQVELLRTFADQAVIAIENVRLFNELEGRNRDLTESLEQQTATSKILGVISQSQTDVQPVFDTIAQAALELCRAASANVFTYDGQLVHLASFVNLNPAYIEMLRAFFPRPPGRDTAVLRAILTRSVVAIPDVLADDDYAIAYDANTGGFRSVLAVPLLRDGNAIGGIAVGRSEAGPFPHTQVALLQTFADQAVIAIGNVRLFNELGARNRELTETLEQQTATSEILRVISRSQTDAQPVFDTIVSSVLALCDASFSGVYLLDGDDFSLVSAEGMTPQQLAAFRAGYPRKVGVDTVAGRAALECRIVQTPDLLVDPDYCLSPGSRVGARTVLGVPLIRDNQAIGSIGVWRGEVRPFSETQIALLQTFADQAVIAIENVRLFRELEARTTALTRSVGELRALGDVGQAVSSTLDLETVLSTIVSRATELTGMDGGSVWEYDEGREEFYLHTADRLSDALVATLRATPIRKGEGALGGMALTGEPVQISDIVDEGSYQSSVREILVRDGYRSLLAVPLMRDNHLLGGLSVNRKSTGAFDADVIALLQTFATQSALAIQNARLFREIETKSRQLETASQHKSEFLANMSHELRTPLNAIIGFSEVLAERLFGDINDKQAEYLADIMDSGRHLLALINDILDLSKIEAGRMELDRVDFEVRIAIDSTLNLVRERAQRRGIEVRCTADERLPKIHADERKVKQVLLNLLSNALKFTPEGGTIDVAARRHDHQVEIAVTDTGVGIAPEDQATVFEEFRQVGTTARKIEGTGLGLAISRRIVELHGGRIGVESEVGRGSTFTFTLPLSPAVPGR